MNKLFTALRLMFVAFVILAPAAPASFADTQSQLGELREVSIVSHGWHTGFVVAAESIQAHIPELKERFSDTRHLEVGWGDRGFYQAKKITPWLTLQALFWPTESVLHVVAVPQSAEEYFPNSQIGKLCLTPEEYANLIKFISNSFEKNSSGQITPLNVGIYGNSQFYQGKGIFHFMSTCNKWTAKGIKSAGMDIMPTFKLTAGSVMNYLAKKKIITTARCTKQ
jgi:uncharacterized protein (TIGR02117 family)